MESVIDPRTQNPHGKLIPQLTVYVIVKTQQSTVSHVRCGTGGVLWPLLATVPTTLTVAPTDVSKFGVAVGAVAKVQQSSDV